MKFFKSTGADYLVHGNDNSNLIDKNYVIEFNRTEGISSSIIRRRVIKAILEKANI